MLMGMFHRFGIRIVRLARPDHAPSYMITSWMTPHSISREMQTMILNVDLLNVGTSPGTTSRRR
jgi:hypothetical protein